MSGIVGIIHHDGRPADREGLARMSEASRSRAVDGEGRWIDGGFAIGHQHSRVTPESATEQQPLAWDDAVVSFDGRLDNREELIASCTRTPPVDPLSDAALVLAAYRTYGDQCAGRLVGDFAFALLDVRTRRLILARDVMAARPLYYTSFENGVAFASEIKSLLAHRQVAAAPDPDGLADLLLNGYCDGHTTWFDGVRSVPPGSMVIVTPGAVTVTAAWDFPETEIRYASHSDYVDHFRALFTQSVRRRLRSAHPVAVAVSGGLDSSAIHCVADRLDMAHVRGFTLAFPRGTVADEHAFVDTLRRRGLQIEDVAADRVRWLVDPDRSVAQTEMPFLAWEEYDRLLARARAAGCRVLLNGFFGDQVLTGEAYLVDLVRRGRLGVIRRHLRETAAWMTDVDPRVPRNWFLRAAARAFAPVWMRRAARVTISRTLGRVPYAPWFTPQFRNRALERGLARCAPPRRFASAHAEESWRVATSGYYLSALLQAGSAGTAHQLDTAHPFRDRDLVAFLMGIPGDVVIENGVPKALLRSSLEGVLPDEIRLRRTKGDATPFSNHAALSQEAMVRRLLGPASLSARAGFVDARALRARMGDIFGAGLTQHDTATLGWQIGDTLALELWLQRFCGGMTCN